MGSRLRWLLASVALGALACGDGTSAGERTLAFVANAGDDSVTVFDVETLAVVSTIDLFGDHPWEIALSADERIAYVMNRDSNTATVIDTATRTETRTIALTGVQPAKGLVASDGFLYVTFLGSSFLAKVDLTVGAETQVGTIALSEPGRSLVESSGGGTLWVGGTVDQLMKVSLGGASESDAFDTSGPIASLAVSVGGELYVGFETSAGVGTFDTGSETFGDELPLGAVDSLDATDLVLDGIDLWVVAAYDEVSGGVVALPRNFDDTGFDLSADDDSSYGVSLPFDFPFMGGDVTEATVSSNGVVALDGSEEDFDTGLTGIVGFAPNNEDLDSSAGLFSYSSRLSPGQVVFQWATAMNEDEEHSNGVSVFELVLFPDGSARFDYLLSMPDAAVEDDGTTYGVGNDAVVVDLRATLGSPYGLERRSFAWDPAQPGQVSEVAFTWVGTGIDYYPGRGHTTGLALTPTRLFVPVSEDADGDALDEVMVIDRATRLPEAMGVPVGADPRAIVVATVPDL